MPTNPNTLSNEEAAAILVQMYEEGYADAVSEALRMGAEALRAQGKVWCVSNRTSSILFLTETLADEFLSSVGATAGMQKYCVVVHLSLIHI